MTNTQWEEVKPPEPWGADRVKTSKMQVHYLHEKHRLEMANLHEKQQAEWDDLINSLGL